MSTSLQFKLILGSRNVVAIYIGRNKSRDVRCFYVRSIVTFPLVIQLDGLLHAVSIYR